VVEHLVAVGCIRGDLIQRLAGCQILLAQLGLLVVCGQIAIGQYGIIGQFVADLVGQLIHLFLRLLTLPGGIGAEGGIHLGRQGFVDEPAQFLLAEPEQPVDPRIQVREIKLEDFVKQPLEAGQMVSALLSHKGSVPSLRICI